MFSSFFKRPSIYIFIFSHLWIVVYGWGWPLGLSETKNPFHHDHEVKISTEPTKTTIQALTPTTTMSSLSTSFTIESSESTNNSNTESPMDKKSESSQSTQTFVTSTTTDLPKIDELMTLPEDSNSYGVIFGDHFLPNKEYESGSRKQKSPIPVYWTTTSFSTTPVTTQSPTITTKLTPTTTPSSTTTTSTTTSITTVNPTTQDPISSSVNSKDKGNNRPFRGAGDNNTDSGTGTVEPYDSGKSNINDSIATPTSLQSNEDSKINVTTILKEETHSNDSVVSYNEITPEYDATRDQRAIGKEDGTNSTETVTTDSTSTMENFTIKFNTTTSPIPTTGQSIVAIDSIARRVNTSSANSIGSYQFLSILLFSLLITQISL